MTSSDLDTDFDLDFDFSSLSVDIDDDGILTITLNRPDKLNALNEKVLEELAIVLSQAQLDENIRGVLLTGEGKAFCAGADISELAETSATTGFDFAKQGQYVFRLLEALDKPSIAAVNGYALGGGCELAMAASIRIASDRAHFAQPEVKLGIIPGYGGTQRLSRLVGKGRAIDLCITGRVIDANTANHWGLVTDVVPHEELLNFARERLLVILENAPLAVSAAMEVIHNGFNQSLDDALHLEALVFSRLCDSHDKEEGTKAFIEKRKPVFEGY